MSSLSFSNFSAGVTRARALGHDLENDPPANTLSGMNRMTCKTCGAAVLGNGSIAYGGALDRKCVPIPDGAVGLTSGPSAPTPQAALVVFCRKCGHEHPIVSRADCPDRCPKCGAALKMNLYSSDFEPTPNAAAREMREQESEK